ncbi:MAG: hypothetical protein IJJ71_07705 [Treponema sp.]|uniref:hypothetical protein n=1 Tax=Treponema sp. TaxID=166 RepID=UPI0025EF6032|nr:hypothetical protein [Treponema sp.]MBR0100653.1 hypothetical protein [Treponema sp.]MBR0496042.1 hypothetical protein [Treponema sp.]
MNRALCIILILTSLFLCSFSYSSYRYSKSAAKSIQTENELVKVSKAFENDFQNLKFEGSDFPNSEPITNLMSNYARFSPSMEDISSGINTATFPEWILNNPKTKTLFENPLFSAKEYGWISLAEPNAKTVKSITDSYKGKLSLFPLVNALPLLNIHYTDLETLRIVLESSGISDSERKSNELYYKVNEAPLTNTEIAELLEVPQNHKVFAIIGAKTTFWKVTLTLDKKKCEQILAAVPKKDEQDKIEKYIVIKELVQDER